MAEEEENLDSLDDEEEEEGKEPEKKKLPDKWVKIATYVLTSIIIFLLSALVSHLVFDFMDDLEESKKEVNNEVKEEELAIKEDFSVFPLPSFRIVLDKAEDETLASIVQVELALAYKTEKEEFILELNDRKQQIRSIVQYITAQKKYREVSTVAKRHHNLKKDLKKALNDVLIEGRILDIFFNTFVITRIPG